MQPHPTSTDRTERIQAARARRAQRSALATALGAGTLDWAAIDACPDWVLRPPDALDRLATHAGAWWAAAALRACIDGRRLAQVHALLGDERLGALRDAPDAGGEEPLSRAPPAGLPEAEQLPAHLLASGRALLGWALPTALRAPVLTHLGWPLDGCQQGAFDAHAPWAHHVVRKVLSEPEPRTETSDVANSFATENIAAGA